jgi:hypothetical protein
VIDENELQRNKNLRVRPRMDAGMQIDSSDEQSQIVTGRFGKGAIRI